MDDIEKRMKDFEDRLAVISNWFGRVKEAVLTAGSSENVVRTLDDIAVYTNIDALNRRLDRIESEMGRAFAAVSPEAVNFAISHMLDVMRAMHRRVQALEKVSPEEEMTFEQWVAKNVLDIPTCSTCEKEGCSIKGGLLSMMARAFTDHGKGSAN